MALTRILGLSNFSCLRHCKGALFFNHSRAVYPVTTTQTCSKRLIGRNFCTWPVAASNDMQKSETEDLIYSVKSLREVFESLRDELSVLREVVRSIQKCNSICTYVSSYESDGTLIQDGEEKATEKRSEFSEAMATNFDTNIVSSQDSKTAEKMSDFSEERVISQDNKAAEKTSGFSEEGVISQDNKAAEKTSNFSEERVISDTEEGNNDTVPDGKHQDLLKAIDSEISLTVKFSSVSCQGRFLPPDFPFMVLYDYLGKNSVVFYRENKLEKIYVTASPPSVFSSVTAENYHHYKTSSFTMPLHVAISPVRAEERSIVFKCSAFSTGFLIEKVSTDSKGLDLIRDLDGDLHKELEKYLEMKGITTRATNTIFGYMLDKVNRRKLRYLYKLRKLVAA